MIGLFANTLLPRTSQVGQPSMCSCLVSMQLTLRYSLAGNFRRSFLSPAAHRLRSLFANLGIEAILLLPRRRAALLTNALVALARIVLEPALVRHQASLVLLPNGRLILPLSILAASLGASELDQIRWLSGVQWYYC